MNKKYSLTRPPANTPKLFETEENGSAYDQLVYAHYFIGSADWYVLEYSPEEDIAYCFAEIFADCGELGYTSLAELEDLELSQKISFGSITKTFPVRVEYESQWTPETLQKCLDKR
jgi:Protein of unknown function (DUF2958)